jgi:hypothetical protein
MTKNYMKGLKNGGKGNFPNLSEGHPIIYESLGSALAIG